MDDLARKALDPVANAGSNFASGIQHGSSQAPALASAAHSQGATITSTSMISTNGSEGTHNDPSAANGADNVPRRHPKLKRLATKPLRIASSMRRGKSSTGTAAGGSTPSTSRAYPTVAESIQSSSGPSMGSSPTTQDDIAARAYQIAKGRTRPLEGEQESCILRVRVVRCEDLAAKDRGRSSDPFITLHLPPANRVQTPIVKKSLFPSYKAEESTFDFPLYDSLAREGWYRGRGLELVIWDKDLIKKEYMGEVSIPVTDWFTHLNRTGQVGGAEAWKEGLKIQKFTLISSRRRSLVTGSIFLQIGLLPPKSWNSTTEAKSWNDEQATKLFNHLARLGGQPLASLMTIPAHEGIGTTRVKRRKRVTGPKSALHAAASRALKPLRKKRISQDLSHTTSGVSTPAEEIDVLDESEDDEEEEDLRDDGLSSDDSDVGICDEDDEVVKDNAGIPIPQRGLSTDSTPTSYSTGSELKRAGSKDLISSPEALNYETDTIGPLRNDSRPQVGNVKIDSPSSDHRGSADSEGYFDRPVNRRRRLLRRRSTREDSQTPGSTGSLLTPGPSGAATPASTRHRKVFKRGKRNRHYNFSDGRDILGIVIMEISSAEDLPRFKGALKWGFDMDPFVVVSFGKKVFRTRVLRHVLNPVWDEKLLFHVRRYEHNFSIQFAVLDWDKVSGNDYVGSLSLPISELMSLAPRPHEETGLYDPGQDGKHEMKEFKLPITMRKDSPWESKHHPVLTFRAKYEPYDALRQKFWRQYLAQYDSDDTGSISVMELTTMLDSLGSTLTTQTIEEYWSRYGKNVESDELTFDEVIRCLEDEIRKPTSERKRINASSNSDQSPAADYPEMAPRPAAEGLDVTGPSAAPYSESEGVDPDDLAAQIQASKPLDDDDEPGNGDSSVKPLETEDNEYINGKDLLNVPSNMSPLSSPGDSDDEDESGDTLDDDMERVVNIKTCPLCHQPRLKKKSEADIITHLAVCASTDWSRVDRMIVGNYVTASQAQRKFFTKILTKVTAGAYSLGANSANIIVQDRETGHLQEEKMAVYVRIGIRVLYKGAKGNMQSSRVRKLLKSMSVKQGLRYDSPQSAAEIPAFIAFHKLNIDEIRDPIESFKTFNEFFYRKLKPESRPIDCPDDPNVLVSCADCRMMAFETVNDATRIWIKGREFSIPRLLGDTYKDIHHKFDDGALGIFRLAPQGERVVFQFFFSFPALFSLSIHLFFSFISFRLVQTDLLPDFFFFFLSFSLLFLLLWALLHSEHQTTIDSTAQSMVSLASLPSSMVNTIQSTLKLSERLSMSMVRTCARSFQSKALNSEQS